MSFCMLQKCFQLGDSGGEYVNTLWPSHAIWLQIGVNIGSGNGLLPDGTKPLPEPMLVHH